MSINSWIRRQFKNNVSTTDYIPAGLSAGAISFTAFDGSTFPDGSVGPFTITVDQGLATEEKVQILSRTGQNFTVNTNGRGYNGTTAQIHQGNCSILHTLDQQDLDEANQTAFQTLGQIQAKGDLLVGSSANNLARLPVGATNTFLQVQGGTLAYEAFGSGQSQTITTSNGDGTQTSPARSDHTHSGVASFNTRNGAVTFTLADAETVYTAAGDIVYGTGSATGAILPVGASGLVLASTGTAPAWQYPALTRASGALGLNFNVPSGTQQTFLTSASLAAGTWLMNLGVTCVCNTGHRISFGIAAGTASVSAFGGQISNEISGAGTSSASLSFLATVSSPGTIVFQAVSDTTSPQQTIQTTTQDGFSQATGYTAVRVA